MEASSGPPPIEPPVFQIGLALAGAISAGAYTGGVIDFLFQALSEWEGARGQPGVPGHRVVLKVIAGASAGAVTGALGAVALARGLEPQIFTPDETANCFPDRHANHQPYRCVLPTLYQTWVTLPDMSGAPGHRGLLDIGDVIGEAAKTGVRSLLNAELLDDIKAAAIEGATPPLMTTAFIANPLHLYMTISNMRGIPFRVAFGRNAYGMLTLADRVHYVISGLGEAKTPTEDWLALDAAGAGIVINTSTLPQTRGGNQGDWDAYGTAALASAAFPIGLSARQLSYNWDYYTRRRYPIHLPLDVNIEPDFPESVKSASPKFVFQSIDGGLVNNDPFDYAQYALNGGPSRGPVSGQTVDRAIIMVAPFTEPPEFLPPGSPSSAMMSVLRALFPGLINQARFRASELAPAVNERDFSRYLIAPLRRVPRTHPPAAGEAPSPLERFAIACGLLGGFGGFLDETFRAHDFQLGRRNCQQFLRTSFLVPAENPVAGQAGKTGQVPVIPLLGDSAKQIPLPLWPHITTEHFEQLRHKVKCRVNAIVPSLIKAQTPSVRLRLALRLGWFVFLRWRTIDYVVAAMLADLIRRNQIQGRVIPAAPLAALQTAWDKSSGVFGPHCLDDVHAILGELMNPAYDLRTPRGIASSTKLPDGFVSQVLAILSGNSIPAQIRVWREPLGYTLWERRPSWFNRQPLVRWLNDWWNAPTVG